MKFLKTKTAFERILNDQYDGKKTAFGYKGSKFGQWLRMHHLSEFNKLYDSWKGANGTTNNNSICCMGCYSNKRRYKHTC